MKNENELISSVKAAKLLGITRSTLYQWTSKKLIPFVRISRNLIKFDPTELQSWIEARRIQAIGSHTPKGQSPGRQEGEAETKRPRRPIDRGTPIRPAMESQKDRTKDGKVSGTKKAVQYRALAHAREIVLRKRTRRASGRV
jgi:excisionase family DNA binding protein